MRIYSYKASTPRVAFTLTALAMSAITICAFVIVPATVEDASGDAAVMAASKPFVPASIVAVADTPVKLVDYVAIHEQALISAGCTTGQRREQDDLDDESSPRLFCAPTMLLR